MNKEFKKIANNKNETRYVLEFASAGASSASGIASSPSALGSKDNILIQSRSQTVSVPVTQKPRQGPLRPQTGAGQHRDKKKEQKQGKEKHRKPFAEGVVEGSDWGEPQEVLADVMSTLERQVEWPLTDVMDPREVQSVLQPVRNAINKKLQSLEQGVAEGDNPEYDDEAGMADNNLETLKRAVQGLDDVINAGDNLPEWCQEKIAVAKSMLVTVWDYMLSNENGEQVSEALGPEDEERQEIVDKLVFAAKTTDSASRELMNLAKDTHSDVADISNDGYAVVMNMVDQLKKYYDFSDLGVTEEKIKGVDGKACWPGKRYAGKVKKADGTYKDKCVEDISEALEEVKKGLYYYVNKRKKAGTSRPASHPDAPSPQDWKNAAKTAKKEEAEVEESGLQYSIGVKKHGKPYMKAAAELMRKGGSQQDLGRLRDKMSKAYKQESQNSDEYLNKLAEMLDNTVNEKSVSQAQWDLMHAVAHNPQFAAKVGVKQSVGKEFTAADAGRDRSKLPKRVVKKK